MNVAHAKQQRQRGGFLTPHLQRPPDTLLDTVSHSRFPRPLGRARSWVLACVRAVPIVRFEIGVSRGFCTVICVSFRQSWTGCAAAPKRCGREALHEIGRGGGAQWGDEGKGKVVDYLA